MFGGPLFCPPQLPVSPSTLSWFQAAGPWHPLPCIFLHLPGAASTLLGLWPFWDSQVASHT